jgi:hypothetical protein
MPEVHHGQRILAEQPGDVIAAVRGDQRVVGLATGLVALCGRPGGVRQIRDPDLARVEQRVGELLSRQVRQADDLGALARRILGGHFADLAQGHSVEDLDAAGRVVLHHDQPPVLRNGAADRIAGLDDATVHAFPQQIHLGQPAVPAEDVAVAAIAGIGDVRMGKVAQPFDPRQPGLSAGFDDGDGAVGTLYHHAQVVGAARVGGRGAAGQHNGGQDEQETQFHERFIPLESP